MDAIPFEIFPRDRENRHLSIPVGARLAIGAAIVASATGYMAYLGASTTWQYYLTVDECLASAADVGDSRLRVHGNVAPGSLEVAADHSQATFQLVGNSGQLAVICGGPLPDNLAENMEVVVEGRLQSGTSLAGERVLTKCASKYQSEGTPSSGSESPARLASGKTGELR